MTAAGRPGFVRAFDNYVVHTLQMRLGHVCAGKGLAKAEGHRGGANSARPDAENRVGARGEGVGLEGYRPPETT